MEGCMENEDHHSKVDGKESEGIEVIQIKNLLKIAFRVSDHEHGI